MFAAAEEPFHHHEQYRDQKDAYECIEGHSAYYCVTHGYTGTGAGAGSDSQGQTAQNKRE